MLVNCPHCSKQLKLGEVAVASLQQVPEGKTLKVKCVHCKESFGLSGTAAIAGDKVVFGKEENSGSRDDIKVKPPKPPTLSELLGKEGGGKKAADSIPRVLLLFPGREDKASILEKIEGIGYQVEEPDGVNDAIERMFSTNFTLVIYHTSYEGVPLSQSRFHDYICQLPMSKRRDIFYVLIGGEMQTFYDLQALACSANFVVNDAELPHITTLLKKAIPEYEDLFGAYLEELQIAGK